MNTPPRISDNDLHAYVDGELDERARADTEAWLAAHPEDAARVATYRRQKDDLHRLFDGALDEPVPPEMTRLVMAARPSRRGLAWTRIAASVALLLAGALGGWGLRGARENPTVDQRPTYVETAVGAHIVYAAEVRHPVEVPADQEAHLVGWLSKRLGQPLRAPDLATTGFQLVGGRLLADAARPAAQFMYEDASGRRITVYLRTHDGADTAFRFIGKERVSAFYWIDAPFAYALAGELPREELLSVAHTVFEDLAPKPALSR